MEIAMQACEQAVCHMVARILDTVSDSFLQREAALIRAASWAEVQYMVLKSIIDMDERSPLSAWISETGSSEFDARVTFTDKIYRLLCLEYMLKGNRCKYCSDEYHGLDWQSRFNLVKGISMFLADLHRQREHPIYHLDLKPSNIYLDMDMMPKITDFGFLMCSRTGTNGIVKYNARIVLPDKIHRSLCFEYMPKGNLDMHLFDEYCPKVHLQTRINAAIKRINAAINIIKCDAKCDAYLHELHKGCFHMDLKPANILLDENMVPKIADFGLSRWFFRAEKSPKKRTPVGTPGYLLAPEYLNENISSIKSDVYSSGAILLGILTEPTAYSKRSEMSPEEFTVIVYENWRNRWKLESSSKQMKRSNQIVVSCLETGKAAKATSSTVFSRQRAVLFFRAVIIAIYSASLRSVFAVALSVHQHLYRSNLTDERSDKPRSSRAPETNSSDETTRASTANKLTDNEAENHSDPNSCVAERDTNEKAKRSGEWYVATGAAHHATGNPDLITNMLEENGGLCVHAADGTPMPVRGCGNVVTDAVVLPDVYYVPGLCSNLVSVGQLAGLDYSVGFGRGTCIVSSPDGTVVGGAHARGDGLYEVDFLRVPLDMP